MSQGLRVSQWVGSNNINHDNDKNEGKVAQAPVTSTLAMKGLRNTMKKQKGQR